MQKLGLHQLIRIKLLISGFLKNFGSIPISKGIKCPFCPSLPTPMSTKMPLLMSQTVITQPYYGAMHDITCHSFIYTAAGATRRNWNEKFKSSSNVTCAERWGNTVPTRSHPTTPLAIDMCVLMLMYFLCFWRENLFLGNHKILTMSVFLWFALKQGCALCRGMVIPGACFFSETFR